MVPGMALVLPAASAAPPAAVVRAVSPGPATGLQVTSRPVDDVLRLDWQHPKGEDADDLRYRVALSAWEDDAEASYVVDKPFIEVATRGVGTTYRGWIQTISPAGDGDFLPFKVVYEDVPGQAVEINPRPRAGGFALKWKYAKYDQARSWEVFVDGVVVPTKVKQGIKRTLLAQVSGLQAGTDYEIGVRGVNVHGAGEALSVVARTYDLPDQMAAPTVKPGRKGGGLSVRVAWTPPTGWGGGEQCCYRITGHGPVDRQGAPARVERWTDAPATRFDFPVGRSGKWRFQVEAKTGAGFSPISDLSRSVRAR
ncbi:Fibronectin type III domain protein [Nocardioides dokdonensis FR1436]|uniref:Fibronectin type III domain protein n=2 Tax=Nocardioides TaxID=1839 RepID=A0A1A9GIU7_9ACTN|nr:Fibronectin type III domain protein [Nocardioides dokdonensis FR1436]